MRLRSRKQKGKNQKKQKKMVGQYKHQLDNLMQHELSRADFLKMTGVALLGLIGVVGFFKNLNGLVPSQTTEKNQLASGGYGRSPYGR